MEHSKTGLGEEQVRASEPEAEEPELASTTTEAEIDPTKKVEPSAAAPPRRSSAPRSAGEEVTEVTASACGCAGGGSEGAEASTDGGGNGGRGGGRLSLVYVLGQLGQDFGSEARRDSFVQHGVSNPHDPAAVLKHLADHPSHATAITWTLNHDATPIYALRPAGAFAAETYGRLREFLQDQISGGAERVSIPGWVHGTIVLTSGQSVPIIYPELRGMYSWSTEALVRSVGKGKKGAGAGAAATKDELANFLERIYYELRNLGASPQERAMNYAATNAFQAEFVFNSALQGGLKLDSIEVERSPICRPDSDCWDVKLTFFHPTKRLEQAREVYRFTVDVSDVVPVTVGAVRNWHVY